MEEEHKAGTRTPGGAPQRCNPAGESALDMCDLLRHLLIAPFSDASRPIEQLVSRCG